MEATREQVVAVLLGEDPRDPGQRLTVSIGEPTVRRSVRDHPGGPDRR